MAFKDKLFKTILTEQATDERMFEQLIRAGMVQAT